MKEETKRPVLRIRKDCKRRREKKSEIETARLTDDSASVSGISEN